MNMNVNFQKAKRNYMIVDIEEEKQTETDIQTVKKKICVRMPKKKIFDTLLNLQAALGTENGGNGQDKTEGELKEKLDMMYELVALILSNNLNGECFSAEWVDKTFDINEIKLLISSYIKFCRGEALNPN